jgi:PST family polysaccharide transporter
MSSDEGHEAERLSIQLNTALDGSLANRRIAIGAIASSAVNILRTAIQLLLLPVMARLLGPEEFGLYALALPTVSLVSLLADGGLGATLAREDESSSLVWSSAFWALFVIGVLLAIGSWLFGILLGYLAGQPALPGMIGLLSISLVFLTLSVVPGARLARRKNLSAGAGAELAATLLGAATAMIMAVRGAGAWSLVAQYVATYAVRAVVLNVAAFRKPKMEFNLSVIRSHLASGGYLVASRLVEYAGRMAETFLIDRIFGTSVLGSYNFGNQIAKYSTDALGSVSWLSLYVQALTTDKSRISLLHLQLCKLLGIALFPAMFLAAAAAPELISVALGPKWVDLSFMLRILLPPYAVSTICSQSGAILIAHNRVNLYFWCVACMGAGRVLAAIVGLWMGLAGTLSCLIGAMLLYCVAMQLASATIMGSPIPMLRGLISPALSSILAATVLFVMVHAHQPSVLRLALGLVTGFAVYLLCMLVIDRKSLAEVMTSFRKVISPAPSA